MKKDSVMKKLFKYIGKYWVLLILSIILAGISVVLQLYVPVLFGNAIDEIVAAHNVDFTQMWLYLKQILLFVVIAAAAIWIMNLSYCTGYPIPGNPPHPEASAFLSGPAQHRRYCEPYHCRYRYPF